MEITDTCPTFGKNVTNQMKKPMEKQGDEPVCLECGDVLQYGSGRSDRKFCCDTCKNRFHNRNMQISRRYRQRITSVLERNYDILDSLRRTSFRNIPMDDLENMGFNKTFFTSYVRCPSLETYMCFDIKYCVSRGTVTSISKLGMEIK